MPTEPPEPRTAEITLRRGIPQPWGPFDAQTRGAFIEAIRNGLTKSAACKALHLNPSKVYKWLKLGAHSQQTPYEEATGRTDYLSPQWIERRQFRLAYNAALAYASSFTKEVKVKAALGYVYEEPVVDDLGRPVLDPKTGQPYTRKVRVQGDWRAADAIDKQRDRELLLPDDRRLRRAQADKEEALARAAKAMEARAAADAERAGYLAELAKRQVIKQQGSVYFAGSFLAILAETRPELHRELLHALEEDGFTLATEEDAARMAEQRDPKRDDEAALLEQLWNMEAGDEPPPEDVS